MLVNLIKIKGLRSINRQIAHYNTEYDLLRENSSCIGKF
ncbi:hypothetical protein BN2497_4355 [Janthinobacterium sp. CG23_2]|nr:hypothetical protein BN2497_4355 [Janthinobacterium sp. CG23_2]CUU28575.1 hypothetical protein BN3177_4355 [Janthinobacterium sp. CG23_2]